MRQKKIEYKPVDERALRAAKIERKKEIKMWDVIYDIGAYSFFIWIILVLSHGNRDPNSFLMRTGLENNFVRASVEANYTNVNLYSVSMQSFCLNHIGTRHLAYF